MSLKRYLVCADSHGHADTLSALLPLLDQVDGLWHLGDHADDLELLKAHRPDLPKDFFVAVRGNCDEPATGPLEHVIECGDFRFLLVHGHRYEVKIDLLRLYHRGLELEVNGCFFGHTHQPLLLQEGGIWLHNPGSLALPKGGSKRSYSVLEIGDDGFVITPKEL